MGFFDWLFGKKAGSEEREEIKFADFDAWVSKRSEKELKQLFDAALPRFAEVKHLLKQTRLALDELREKKVEGEQGDKRLRKIVGTSKSAFAERMKQLLEKLQPPTAADFDSVRDYCLNAGPLMEREINSFGKNIAYTSIILKEEVSNIGSNIKELQELLKGLNDSFFEKPAVRFAAEIKANAMQLSEKLSERLSISESLEEASVELQRLLKQTESIEKGLAELEKSAGFQALFELEAAKKTALEKKSALRAELVDLLAPIDKPLRRLESLVESNAFLLEKNAKEFLQLFLRDPVLAIKQDPRADILKKLLRELQQAIDSGKVSLKDEKEREKRLSALANLVSYDFFSNFFWKFNQIEVELQKVEKELLHNTALQKKSALERELSSAKSAFEEKKKAVEAVQKKRSALETEIASLKELLEKLAGKLSGKKVEIKLN